MEQEIADFIEQGPSDALAEAEGGFDFLPRAAIDEEVKRLDREIKLKEQSLQAAEKESNESKERIRVMQEHLRNVQQELASTQQLVDAKQKEIETEVHLKQLAEREAGKIAQDILKNDRLSQEQQDQLNLTQNNIFRGNERLDQFKLQLNWNQEELEQWALAAKQKEEDNLALRKYTHADEQKIKELVLASEKLNKEVQRKRAELENEVTETLAAQIELDKTAEDFRKLHKERQELVRQWEASIDAMQRRDEAIKDAGEQLVMEKARIADKEQHLRDKKKFLENEQANNREQENKIIIAERTCQKYRAELVFSQEQHTALQDELEVVKNTLGKLANDLSNRRNEVASLRTGLENKKDRLELVKRKNLETKRKLESEYMKTDDLDKNSKAIERIFKEEEQQLKLVERELQELKELMFKESQELFRLRQEEANYIAEISGAQTADKNLRYKIQALDNDSMKQQELIYNADYQIQALERKVARAGGERTAEEKKVLNARIQVLTEQLDETTAKHAMLVQQMKRLQDDLRACKRSVDDLNSERSELNEKISELNLQNDTVARALRQSLKSKEDTIVQHDLLRLENKKLRDILNGHADQVTGLENRKAQLQMSMEERTLQIQEHREILRADLKLAEEERHKVTMELREKELKVEVAEKRFQVICGRMALEEGETERPSPAYYIVKRAQEREELQREGDELDEKIRKTEREIRALEQTLSKVNNRNQAYRTSFHRADLSGQEISEKNDLERRLDRAVDKRKAKKAEMEALYRDVQSISQRLDNLEQERSGMTRQVEVLASKMDQLDRELGDQNLKKERAFKAMTKYSKELRKKRGGGGETAEEKEFRVLESKEAVKLLLSSAVNVAREHPELAQRLDESLRENNIKPPSAAPSRASSERGGSERSSVGSLGTHSSVSSHNGSVASGHSRRSGKSQTGSVRSASSRPGSQMASSGISSVQLKL